MNAPANPILIGCSGWSYPDWEGTFYPGGMIPGDYLEFYADRFPIVEVDSTFYSPPSSSLVRRWRDRTPDDFRFVPKVPKVITHDKQLRDCSEEMEGFVSSILPLGPKLAAALLQMGYFNRGAFATLEQFLEVLDAFLGRWPHQQVPLAVEIRNARWLGGEFVELLRSHGAVLTLTEQTWMPTPRQVAQQLDPVTGPLSLVRLLGDRTSIEKITQTWDKVVVDRSADLAETSQVIETLSRRVPVFVFANNHYAGHAPETVRQLRSLLQIPEPVPHDRPRSTLFD